MNNANHHHITPKRLKLILIGITVVFIIISIIGILTFSWFGIMVIPLSFLLYAAFQATSDHLVEFKKFCPECNTPNHISSDVC